MPEWVTNILEFWFKELTAKEWFGSSEALDEKTRSRFLAVYEKQKNEFKVGSTDNPRTALAAIILFDQFPRNMFRKTAAAFSTDDLALCIAQHALEKQYDAQMTLEEKPFCYMPFMHSEVAADQERSVNLFRSIGKANSLDYAIEHRDIIAEYGRFPHRNQALGRESTPQEIAFLEKHSGYGQ